MRLLLYLAPLSSLLSPPPPLPLVLSRSFSFLTALGSSTLPHSLTLGMARRGAERQNTHTHTLAGGKTQPINTKPPTRRS